MQLLVLAVAAMLVWFAGAGGKVVETIAVDGPDEQGYRWEKTLPEIPKDRCPVERVADVYLKCEEQIHAVGCTRRDEAARACTIYLPKRGLVAWEEAHEDRHRQGWVHPGSRALKF